MNPAFERTVARNLDRGVASRRSLRLCELVRPQDRDQTEMLLRDLLDSRCNSFDIEARGASPGQAISRWTAWRQPGRGTEPDHALLVAPQTSDTVPRRKACFKLRDGRQSAAWPGGWCMTSTTC